MDRKYPIDVICNCLLTVRLIERGGRGCGLLIYGRQLNNLKIEISNSGNQSP